jgi:hypothetical protein
MNSWPCLRPGPAGELGSGTRRGWQIYSAKGSFVCSTTLLLWISTLTRTRPCGRIEHRRYRCAGQLLFRTSDPSEDMMRQVFLSHSLRDGVLAEQLASAFLSYGMATASIATIGAATDFRSGLRRAMSASDVCIVLISSPFGFGGTWLGYEIGVAEGLGKPIIILASRNHPRSSLPFEVMSHQVIEFDPAALEDVAREVIPALDRLLSAA